MLYTWTVNLDSVVANHTSCWQAHVRNDSGDFNSTEKFSTLQNSNITDYVGLFSADMYIYSSSVSNNIAFNIFNDKAASKSISHLNQLPEDFLLFFNGINISQGERQKVLLDRCLQHEKDIYVFDEPDTNLDFNSQREMIKIFDELKKGVRLL